MLKAMSQSCLSTAVPPLAPLHLTTGLTARARGHPADASAPISTLACLFQETSARSGLPPIKLYPSVMCPVYAWPFSD
jgi:hypothetical protein